jgi:hypothetical protein
LILLIDCRLTEENKILRERVQKFEAELAVYKSNDPLVPNVVVPPYRVPPGVVTNWENPTVSFDDRVLKKQKVYYAPHQNLGGIMGDGGTLNIAGTCCVDQYLASQNSWGTVLGLNEDMTSVRVRCL